MFEFLSPIRSKTVPEAMRSAGTYEAWAAMADAYDRANGLDQWKSTDAGESYDYRFFRGRLEQMRTLLKRHEYRQLMFLLSEDMPFYNSQIGKPSLYDKAMLGTKQLIHDYIAEVCHALEELAAVDAATIPIEEKRDFFLRTSRCYGHSALMLSGGAVLGFFHAGVLRALFDQGLLPSVISGSSAGSILAAVACTHSDDELRQRLTTDSLHLEIEKTCSLRPEVSLLENQKALIDAQRLYCYLENIIPDLTFREAYGLTGRSLNITVTGLKPQQESRLLNAVSSPNVYIRSAVMASCAIYGIYPPVTLVGKTASGERVHYLSDLQWIDGSFVDDLPARRLARLYGVNHFISSMTNPAALALTPDPEAENNLFAKSFNYHARLCRKFITETLRLSRDNLRVKSPVISLLQHLSYSVFAQDYTADINIFLRNRWDHPLSLLDEPSRQEMRDLIREGEFATWEKMEMVRNCTAISRTLQKILQARKF